MFRNQNMTMAKLRETTQELFPRREQITWSPMTIYGNNTPDLEMAEIINPGLKLKRKKAPWIDYIPAENK